ncbi:hypothetical protein A6E01_19395 (plasmid) [Vibrio breoganii]|uniref:Uncharacterized protein n=2 Tax=Vibrio TaxID=662 RepID=A0AAN0XZ79_9VIBR|nr:hypothetical protein [Vibrio breoganii]ANO35381.1 hypothetical protein A6E01_19395 [Vibrio breoganii]PML12697.1 hypothetical protein BCT84_02110 [Vibrio breoganii]
MAIYDIICARTKKLRGFNIIVSAAAGKKHYKRMLFSKMPDLSEMEILQKAETLNQSLIQQEADNRVARKLTKPTTTKSRSALATNFTLYLHRKVGINKNGEEQVCYSPQWRIYQYNPNGRDELIGFPISKLGYHEAFKQALDEYSFGLRLTPSQSADIEQRLWPIDEAIKRLIHDERRKPHGISPQGIKLVQEKMIKAAQKDQITSTQTQ